MATSIDPQAPTDNRRDMVCHFISLPGEVHNLIYTYALHEPDGLTLYGEDERGDKGGAFVCKKEEEAIYQQHRRDKCAARERDQEKIDDLYDTKYAALQDANQLKFTCRHLYRETRRLGLFGNKLFFASYEDTVLFLDLFEKEEYGKLGTLCPTHEFECEAIASESRAMRELVTRCRKSPNLKIHVQVRYIDAAENNMVIRALDFAIAVKRKRSVVQAINSRANVNDPKSSSYRTWLRAYASELDDWQLPKFPSNVRFYPYNKMFEPQKLKAELEASSDDSTSPDDAHMHIFGADMDWWLRVVKHMVEEGF